MHGKSIGRRNNIGETHGEKVHGGGLGGGMQGVHGRGRCRSCMADVQAGGVLGGTPQRGCGGGGGGCTEGMHGRDTWKVYMLGVWTGMQGRSIRSCLDGVTSTGSWLGCIAGLHRGATYIRLWRGCTKSRGGGAVHTLTVTSLFTYFACVSFVCKSQKTSVASGLSGPVKAYTTVPAK